MEHLNGLSQVSNSNEQRFRKFQPEDGWNGSILLLPGPISKTEKIHSKLVEKNAEVLGGRAKYCSIYD